MISKTLSYYQLFYNIWCLIVFEPVVKLEKVDLSLGSGAARVHILKSIDFSVATGEKVSLVGPSGSGKSTLLMVIGGLEHIDSGRLSVIGQDLTGRNEDWLSIFRGRHIGVIFQSFHLIPNMTALENVSVPLELAGVSDAFERAEKELGLVGLADRLHHYPGELSGGEQQRVAIARALVVEPAILIADEPTGNLDDKTGKQIADLIFETVESRAMTLILVTHDLSLAKRCNRVVEIRSGRIDEEAGKSNRNKDVASNSMTGE